MNKLVINGHAQLIPARWEECPTEEAIRILELKERAFPPALFRIAVLLVLLGVRETGWKQKAWLWGCRLWKGLRPKAGTKPWFAWMVLARLTAEQVDEFLQLVAWAEGEIQYASWNGMLMQPDIWPVEVDGVRYRLPGNGLVHLSWAQMMEAEASFRQFVAEPSRELAVDTICHLFMRGISEYDKHASLAVRPAVEQWSEAKIHLVLGWFSQCWKYMEACHPLTHEGSEEETSGDGYGLVGLTHRLAAHASDVGNVERMTAWHLLDHLEIKLADAKKLKHDTGRAE